MVIAEEEFEQYRTTISIERLRSFFSDANDSMDSVIRRYEDNIRISQALYPELSILEVTLRNAINSMLCKCISQTWIEDEIKQQKLLSNQEYDKLVRAYNDVKASYPNNRFSLGKVIANLNLGFWTGLCSKWYSSNIWNKSCCFKGVFVNYPGNSNKINQISLKLRSIRKLRNRIFHHEPILTKNLAEKYNDIIEILDYLPHGNPAILKNTSNFLDVYNAVYSHNKAKT